METLSRLHLSFKNGAKPFECWMIFLYRMIKVARDLAQVFRACGLVRGKRATCASTKDGGS